MAKNIDEIEVYESSGNVFADLECKNPEELKLKAKIAASINSIIKHRHIAQVETAEVLGITQPQVSDLKKGKLKHFSVERLFDLLNALGRDVEIVIKKKSSRTQREARTEVIAA
ncbi:MAG: XRE family transcriptional regulator [Chlorobi bacterium]|nr:XRE family transcriptional regulator [Chlorobiota bacterium]